MENDVGKKKMLSKGSCRVGIVWVAKCPEEQLQFRNSFSTYSKGAHKSYNIKFLTFISFPSY